MGQIQRIQSIYLLVAGLLSASLFLFPFASAEVQQEGVFKDGLFNYEDHIALLCGSAALLALSLLVIFMYNNRTLQMNLIKLNLLLSIAMITLPSYILMNIGHNYNMGIALFVPAAVLLMLILANRAILVDEKLVRDSDRLR